MIVLYATALSAAAAGDLRHMRALPPARPILPDAVVVAGNNIDMARINASLDRNPSWLP